jgi:hypothetical protein
MLFLGRLLLLLPPVLQVDVDPSIGELLGEHFGPSERVGEDGGPPFIGRFWRASS